MLPTKDRNHLSVSLEYEGNIFLFDCGENTQRQIKIAKLPIGKIRKIFISHWHGDHVLGLPGIIQTLNGISSVEKIEIFGPKGSKRFVSNMLKISIFELKKQIIVNEIDAKLPKTILDNKDYRVSALNLKHSVKVLGYCFEKKDKINLDKDKLKKLGLENNPLAQKLKKGENVVYKGKEIKVDDVSYIKRGRKLCFIFDTKMCSHLVEFVKDADYLVMEATLLFEKHEDKAEETSHMTAKETAEVALMGGVKNLYITHFSQRYEDVGVLEDEAKEIFENTNLTYDFMKVDIR